MNQRATQLLFLLLLLLGASIGVVVYNNSNPTQKSTISKQASSSLKTVTKARKAVEERSRLALHTEKAFPGFTLFGESGTELVKLINMSGNVVHSWNFDAARSRLLPTCNLLTVHGTKWGWAQKKWDALRPFIREYTWDGDIAWEHEVPGPAHHDVQRLPNGNTLILFRGIVPKSFKQNIENPEWKNAKIRTDSIREVTPSGEVAWEWHAHEHLDLNSCGKDPCEPLVPAMQSGKRVFDWTHTNGISPLPDNRFYREGDKRFTPGNILITLRQWSTVILISKETGEVLWQFDRELSGGHEGIMIEEPLPGAGNILIFNNGRDKLSSSILEIDPISKDEIWSYRDTNFFSRAAGVSQRLPNGNTLISEDVPGKIFEVTSAGERVWEYHAAIRTARARRYAQDYCNKLGELPLRD